MGIRMNERTVTLKLQRHEVADLLLACDIMLEDGTKWKDLHEKIWVQLKMFDQKLQEADNND